MNARIEVHENIAIEVDLSKPLAISIPIKNGSNNPNCYWAEDVKFEIIRTDDFVGSVAEGGSVNYQKLTITPHGNGTHVECYGHITNSGTTVSSQLNNYHFYTQLVSLTPELTKDGDSIIQLNDKLKKLSFEGVKAFIIRTLPNNEEKLTRSYSGTNPTYLSKELIDFLVSKGIDHLLIDLPSLDKEIDSGVLASHNAFWGLPNNIRAHATVTELVYIPDYIPDGNYLLNLQTIDLEMDAAPCKPTLYTIENFIILNT